MNLYDLFHERENITGRGYTHRNVTFTKKLIDPYPVSGIRKGHPNFFFNRQRCEKLLKSWFPVKKNTASSNIHCLGEHFHVWGLIRHAVFTGKR
jgi:hypothetical protein